VRLHLMRFKTVPAVVLITALAAPVRAKEPPPPEAFQVLRLPDRGPRMTPFLRHQLDRAWKEDDERRRSFEAVRTESDLLALQGAIRGRLLEIVGGLPEERTPLNAQIAGTIPGDGYRIDKIVFESLPGLHVTALLYVPDGPAPASGWPAVLVACGHSPLGKAHPAYQEISGRLAKRGYLVLCWDPVGQGERSQFWDSSRGRSRYNLICGEHAVLGNLATLAGTSLLRFMVWDGMRAVDYLLSRPEVDGGRIAITGTSGGGLQSAWIGALDARVGVIAPSCFVTALAMRMANRIFEDPDSDPEQDPPGLVSSGIDHAGLLLLAYPRPVHVAAAVKDFVPIEGTRKTLREVGALYGQFGHADRIALAEGFHGHEYSAENQEAAFRFLDRWSGLPPRSGLDPVRTLPPEALRCTPSGQVRVDLKGRSLQDVIREYFLGRPKAAVPIVDLYRGGPPIPDWRLVRYEGHFVDGAVAWEATGRWEGEDAVVDRYVLRHSDGLALPLVYIHGPGAVPGRVLLRVGLEGKLGREDWPEIEEHLVRGDALVSFDPRGLGETRMPYKAVSIDDAELAQLDDAAAYLNPISGVLANYAYNALLTGRPYFFDMIEDAQIALRFTQGHLGARHVAVVGRGEAHTLAAAVAAVAGLDLEPLRPGERSFSWAEAVEGERELWPVPYLVPGGAYLRLER
jgi:hypothetical protein